MRFRIILLARFESVLENIRIHDAAHCTVYIDCLLFRWHTPNRTSFPITTLRIEFVFLAHFCMVAAEEAINRFSMESILAESGTGVSSYSTFPFCV